MRRETIAWTCCVVLALTLLCAMPTQAGPNFVIPSPSPGVLHMDTGQMLLSPFQITKYRFYDEYSAAEWLWESEIHNPNGRRMVLAWAWWYRGQFLDGALLDMDPGSSFCRGIVLAEWPEQGPWEHVTNNYTQDSWGVHSTVLEDLNPPVGYRKSTPDCRWIRLSYSDFMRFVEDPSPDVGVGKSEIVPLPEPASLLALGGGLMGLAGMVMRRRR